MKDEKVQVLLLDDEEGIRSEINEFLRDKGFFIMEAATPSEAFIILSKNHVDIAILDIRLPDMSGIEVLRKIKLQYPGITNIIISGHGDMDSVIEALREGAVDYFKKPFELKEIYKTIKRHIPGKHHHLKQHQKDLDNILISSGPKDESIRLIASSPDMKIVLDKMRMVARSSDTTVLVTGESGTGKELVARGIHQLSDRNNESFVAVNCSSVPDELFESEFFGFNRGAFTNAFGDKKGWFEAANKGTLFLDEIADLKPNLQSKLLRIMEDRNITRLGSTKPIKVDIRIVAATNNKLEELVEKGKFRKDLFHRLNIFTIDLPPLRERRESIPILFSQFIEYYCEKLGMTEPRIDKKVFEILNHYDFPGNVRELQHMIERALILCEGNALSLRHFDHLQNELRRKHTLDTASQMAIPLETLERDSIEVSLRNSGYNKSKTARMLNISRQALDRRIDKYKIKIPE